MKVCSCFIFIYFIFQPSCTNDQIDNPFQISLIDCAMFTHPLFSRSCCIDFSLFSLHADLSRLLATLQMHSGGEEDADLSFLNRVLTSKEMTHLLRVHKKITAIVGRSPSPSESGNGYDPEMIIPLVSNSYGISCEVIEILQSYLQRSGSRDSRELIRLLHRPAFQVNNTKSIVLIGCNLINT